MSTSANVIEYNIIDKNGEIVGYHRQNILCKTCNDGLEKYDPPSEFKILPWGYDENEEEWYGKEQNLEDWLKKNPAEISFKKS